MRVLVVTHNYPRFHGDPAGSFVARLAEATAAAGAEVRVLAPHVAGTAEREVVNGVTVRRFRYAPATLERVGYRGDLHRQRVWSPLVALGVPAMLVAFAAAVRREARSFRPTIVHAHWWMPGGLLAASMSTVPLVITCHGSDVRLLDGAAVWRRVAGYVFSRAARVTTVSRFLARDLTAAFPELAPRLSVTPMPVDEAHFSTGLAAAKAVPPRVLYAGNLLESKGVDDLVEACALLAVRGVPCRLKVLGEGAHASALRARSRDLRLDVEWSDFVPQTRMAAEYGASTVTVLPTRGRHEGLGLTLVEALLAGSAVVGTRVGGIPEVVDDGVTGLLVAPEDPRSLADALERLLCDRALRDRLIAAGRSRAATTYGAAAASQRVLSLYDDVLDRRHAA
jgi:glycosyltransferase involved in cell wall biosynthesis